MSNFEMITSIDLNTVTGGQGDGSTASCMPDPITGEGCARPSSPVPPKRPRPIGSGLGSILGDVGSRVGGIFGH